MTFQDNDASAALGKCNGRGESIWAGADDYSVWISHAILERCCRVIACAGAILAR